MLSWVLDHMGLDASLANHWHLARLEVRHIWVPIVGLLFLVPAGWYLFRKNLSLTQASISLRVLLTVLRLGLLLLLTLVLADPVLILDFHTEKKPILAILLDQSQSMALPSGERQQTRFELGRSLIHKTDIWEPLRDQCDIQFFMFGETVHPRGSEADSLPSDPATHLGDVIHFVRDHASGRPVAGIVLITDGQCTGGNAPIKSARAAKAPIFPVPTGLATRLQDVSIVETSTGGLVSVGDQTAIAVTIESQGFDKRVTNVELLEDNKVLDTKEVTLNSLEQQQVQLTFRATVPGVHALKVKVLPQPEEPAVLRINNNDTVIVRVSDQKLKVLYLEGLPRWDFRFLKNYLQRDRGLVGRLGKGPDLILEAEWRRLSQAQQVPLLPETLEQLAEYHVVILGDVAEKLVTPKFVDLLDRAVRDKGVGLIVQAGPNAMPSVHGEKLKRLLPVQLRRDSVGIEPPLDRPFRVALTAEGSIQESLQLFDDPQRNRQAWDRMPPFWWCAAVERVAPGATVLATNPGVDAHNGKMPLIAYHHAGQGKVLFLGTDSTWTWRQSVGDRYFDKFWGQSIRFMARDGDRKVGFDPGNGREPMDEFRQPNVNRGALEQLAEASGGRVVEPQELPRLFELVHANVQQTELHSEASLWDNGLTLFLMAFLFSLDVGVRRWKGLG